MPSSKGCTPLAWDWHLRKSLSKVSNTCRADERQRFIWWNVAPSIHPFLSQVTAYNLHAHEIWTNKHFCLARAIQSDNETILERFKNQPTILKFPTLLTKLRQLNQLLQRNRRNITTLLPLTNKQTNLRHFKPPQTNTYNKQVFKHMVKGRTNLILHNNR